MKRRIQELDLVEVTEDLPGGLIEGARGVVVAVHGPSCTVEFTDADGLTVGLFEIATGTLELVEPAGHGASIARDE